MGRLLPGRGQRAGALVLAIWVSVLPSCSSSPVPGRGHSATTRVQVPLTTSAVTSGNSWAVVAMGHLDDPDNTFWQLMTRPAGTSRWVLATPPGVASNGGLVASYALGTVFAGFEPSQGLLFSPLARTTVSPATWSDGQAARWSTGVLPGALAVVPDALAGAAGQRYLALLREGGGRVVASSGDLSSWSTVTSMPSLAGDPVTSACGIVALTAVAVAGGGADVLGASCSRGARPGIFTSVGGRWKAVGPELPGATGPAQVLRLWATSAGVAALVEEGDVRSRRVFAVSGHDGLRSWTRSAPLRLGQTALVATGVTGTGGMVVVVGGIAGARSAWAIGPTGGRWRPLPAPPAGTAAVVGGPGDTFEALIVDQSTLDVDVLGAGGWQRIQTLSVAIQYGSSS